MAPGADSQVMRMLVTAIPCDTTLRDSSVMPVGGAITPGGMMLVGCGSIRAPVSMAGYFSGSCWVAAILNWCNPCGSMVCTRNRITARSALSTDQLHSGSGCSE